MNNKTMRALRLGLLAASASVIASAAHAAESAPASAPTYVVSAMEAPPAAPQDDVREAAPGVVKAFGFAARFAGVLALGIRLIGRKRLEAAAAIVRPHVDRVAAAASAAARSVTHVAARPVRMAALAIGLGIFALTGIDVLNIEWAIGLALASLLTLFGAAGLWRMRRA